MKCSHLLSQRGDNEEVEDDAGEGQTHLDEHQGHTLRRRLHHEQLITLALSDLQPWLGSVLD